MSSEKVAMREPVRPDALSLLSRAVDNGAPIETVERLIALSERMRDSQAREAWHEAMAAFQQECPPITKSDTATIVTDRAKYSYSYAPLDAILAVVRPVLGKHHLSLSWVHRIEPNQVVADCVVSHVLGHRERSGEVAMPISRESRMNPAQSVGSAMTYAKRYSAVAILGISPEDDDDAHAQDGAVHHVDRETGEIMEGALSASPVCTECGSGAAVIKGKAEFGGGWLCFKKKGGCGHKWSDEDEEAKSSAATAPVFGSPAYAQNAKDRTLLLDSIATSARTLGFMKSDYKKAWDQHVGRGVSEEAAPIDKLMALVDALAERVRAKRAGEPAPAVVAIVAPEEIPF